MNLRNRRWSVVVPAVAAMLALSTTPLLTAAPAAAAGIIGGPRMGTDGVVVGAGATPLPSVRAQSWMVVDLNTGDVLAAKAPHVRLRPASTLKTLTTATLMPHLSPNAVHLVTAQEQAPVYGSRVGLVVGATYTIDQLWHGLLLPSGNDAAAALAAAYGGLRKTVAAMNAEARHLQAYDTTVVNPSGLDADGQYISAYDMALFAQAALALPEFVAVSHTISYDFPGKMPAAGKARPTYKIYGENRLLNHGYPGVIAGKTGYTTLAHRTFWVAATRGGHTVLVTLMNIRESTESAARKLMTWGLANAGRAGAVGTLVKPLPAPAGTTSATTSGSKSASPATTHAASPVAAGTTGTEKSTSVISWLVLLVLVVAGLFWWRSRRSRGPAQGAHSPGAPGRPGAPPAPDPAATIEHDLPTGPVATVRVQAPPTPAPAPTRAVSVIAGQPTTVAPSAPAEVTPPATAARPVPPTGNVTVVRPARPADLDGAEPSPPETPPNR